MASEKQKLVLAYLKQHGSITIPQAVGLIGYGIYYNHENYVGKILAGMVKQGMIHRVKRGVFAFGGESKDEKSGDLFG